MPTWLMQTQSLLIVALMIIGVRQLPNRARHVKCMAIAMIWDIILILQIELSRQAILKASNAVTNPMWLNIHVSIAVSTVVLYGFMVATGRKVLAGDHQLISRHRKLGYSTLFMRVMTFATSFMAVAPKE